MITTIDFTEGDLATAARSVFVFHSSEPLYYQLHELWLGQQFSLVTRIKTELMKGHTLRVAENEEGTTEVQLYEEDGVFYEHFRDCTEKYSSIDEAISSFLMGHEGDPIMVREHSL